MAANNFQTVKYGAITVLDPWSRVSPLHPCQKAVDVTLNEFFGIDIGETTQPIVCRMLYTGSGGDITVIQKDESSFTFTATNPGTFLNAQAIKVTATTCTGLAWCL